MHLEVVCSSILSGVEEADVLHVEVVTLGRVACEEVHTEVGVLVVGDGGHAGLGQIDDHEAPVALGPGDREGVAVTGPACAGAHEELTLNGRVGAVGDGHVVGQNVAGAQRNDGHVGIAACGGPADEGVVALGDDLGGAELVHVGGGGTGQGVQRVGIQHEHGIGGISGLGLGLGLGLGFSLGLGLGISLGSGLCGGLLRLLGGLLGLCGGFVGLCGGSLGGGLDSGVFSNGGIGGLFATGTSHSGEHQGEHESCDQKKLLHGGVSFP